MSSAENNGLVSSNMSSSQPQQQQILLRLQHVQMFNSSDTFDNSTTATTTTPTTSTNVSNGNGTNGVMKRKCNFITVEEKYKALRALERKETTVQEVCTRLDVGKSTVQGWLTQRDKIYEDFESRQSMYYKRMRVHGAKNRQIEELLLNFISTNRDSGNMVALSSDNLISKSIEFAKILGDEDFKCDIHWLNRFRKKYHIRLDFLKPVATGGDLITSAVATTATDALNFGGHEANSFSNTSTSHLNNDDLNGLSVESVDENSNSGNRHLETDADNLEAENFFDEAETDDVPSNQDIRNYISKMRAFYLNKIDECNRFLRQLDDMEINL